MFQKSQTKFLRNKKKSKLNCFYFLQIFVFLNCYYYLHFLFSNLNNKLNFFPNSQSYKINCTLCRIPEITSADAATTLVVHSVTPAVRCLIKDGGDLENIFQVKPEFNKKTKSKIQSYKERPGINS